MTKHHLSSHVLDTSRGCPAEGIRVSLEVQEKSGTWKTIGQATTNSDGRILDWGSSFPFSMGTYRLTFETAAYFRQHAMASFYPYVVVIFVKQDERHYHVPVLLSPYGYSTYRGS